ncbi:MAG: aminoacyl-tRNA hydrolase [Bdellovibrionales bacterium]|nr:aminoacyl-tRNA hydrolase [Bdellovibrionales bacterium]
MTVEGLTTDDVLIVGLGNPGKEYEKTRHNAGFMVVDQLHEAFGGASLSGGWSSKFQGLHTKVRDGDRKILLLKPETFMNLSGKSVQQAAKFFQIPVERICVVHDDLDFPLGTCRLRLGGGDGGHNGLKSITQQMGSKNYLRLRFGIGRPNIPEKADISRDFVHSWVLGAFSSGEKPALELAIEGAVKALEQLLRDGFERTQNNINQRN